MRRIENMRWTGKIRLGKIRMRRTWRKKMRNDGKEKDENALTEAEKADK